MAEQLRRPGAGWWRYPSALGAGAITVLAFAPFGWYPLAVLGVAAWYHGLQGRSRRAALAIGWTYGIGLFGLGVFWIRVSLDEFANLPSLAANGLMAVFVVAMALYYGLAAWCLVWIEQALRRTGQAWAGPLLALPGIWVLGEWLRSWFLTGFPWLPLGNSQIDAPLAGWLPVFGVYGVSLLVALSAGLFWLILARPGLRLTATALLLAVWTSGGFLRAVDWTDPIDQPVTVALVQANIAPSLKWQPEALETNLEAHLVLTREHMGTGVIVWPETAIPSFLHEVEQPLIGPLAEHARAAGSELVIGVPIMEPNGHYYNGLLSIGTAEDRYYKRHLVPFGEYLPLGALIGPLVDWFDVPMSSFSAGRAEHAVLRVGPYPVGVSICYEDVFPDLVRDALPQAAYLLNVTNDAWFGDSLAPAQHLEFARVRAAENGRYMVRATNTGISAIIDAKGRILATLPAFERGALVGEVQPFAGETPFSRIGSLFAVTLAAAMAGSAVLIGHLRSRRLL